MKRKTKKKVGKKRKHKKKNKGGCLLLFILVLIICMIVILLYHKYGKPFKYGEYTFPPFINKTYTERKKEVKPSINLQIDATKLCIPTFTTPRAEQIVSHTGYTVSYHPIFKIPNWVGYELTREKTKGQAKRSNTFIPDPKIKDCKVHTSDYGNSGYDRGHMAPAADMKWSNQAIKESFHLSNICPQHPELNRRRWKDLEDKTRDWAIADSAIIVICGPLMNSSPKTIGKNRVAVPEGFFKVILSPYVSSPQAIGFLFKNKPSTSPLHTYVVTVDSIEKITGIDFFSELPDSLEEIIELKADKAYFKLQK